jgi:RNA polymerase sigma factor (sigma-70 family)
MDRSSDLVNLVASVLSGDEEAFRLLRDSTAKYVRFRTSHFHIYGADAEDIESKVFERAYKNLKSLKSPVRFPSWLIKIADHVIIDTFRRKRYPHVELSEAIPDRTIAIDQYVIETEIKEERIRRVMSELSMLSNQERRALTLRFFSEWELDRIANELGISVNAVKCTLNSGLKKLRQKVGK